WSASAGGTRYETIPVSRVEIATAIALGTLVLAADSMIQTMMVTVAPTRLPTHTFRAGLALCICAITKLSLVFVSRWTGCEGERLAPDGSRTFLPFALCEIEPVPGRDCRRRYGRG